MTWYTQEMFTWVEVFLIVLLAALPMSQIASIILGVVEEKTGIRTHSRNNHEHDD